MSKTKKTSTQTNKQLHKTDMSTWCKMHKQNKQKNRNAHFAIKQVKKIDTAPDKSSKKKISSFESLVQNRNNKHSRNSAKFTHATPETNLARRSQHSKIS